MNLNIGLIAEAATEKAGQLNLLGTFDVIYAPTFPVQSPQFALVIKLSGHPAEVGQHAGRITARDSDGRPLTDPNGNGFQVEFGFELAQHQLGGWMNPSMQMVLNIAGMTFSKPDTYTFSITVDGHHLGDIPLHVLDAPGPNRLAA